MRGNVYQTRIHWNRKVIERLSATKTDNDRTDVTSGSRLLLPKFKLENPVADCSEMKGRDYQTPGRRRPELLSRDVSATQAKTSTKGIYYGPGRECAQQLYAR